MSDNEHTSPLLGDRPRESACSHELSVQNPVCDPIPEFIQRPEKGSKRPSAVDRQNSRDVFPNDPVRSVSVDDSEVGEHKVSTGIIQTLSQSGHRKTLTRAPADQNIGVHVGPFLIAGHVAEIRHVRVMVRQHRAGERVDLGEGHRAPTERRPCNGRRFDTAECGQILHAPGRSLPMKSVTSRSESTRPSTWRRRSSSVRCDVMARSASSSPRLIVTASNR